MTVGRPFYSTNAILPPPRLKAITRWLSRALYFAALRACRVFTPLIQLHAPIRKARKPGLSLRPARAIDSSSIVGTASTARLVLRTFGHLPAFRWTIVRLR